MNKRSVAFLPLKMLYDSGRYAGENLWKLKKLTEMGEITKEEYKLITGEELKAE